MKPAIGKKKLTKCIMQYLVASMFVVSIGGVQAVAPVVTIEKPNSDGISLNRVNEWNVGAEGLVLNNAIHEVESQLAGVVAANAQLEGQAATMIVQEVTGNRRSALEGSVEIAGQRADLIIANPNGIYVNGASFFNANQVSLYGGSLFQDESHADFSRIHIADGSIDVGKKGIQATDNSLILVGRTVQVDGKVYAKQIKVVAGHGDLSLDSPMELKKADAPQERLIDISKTGGMYANSIYIQAEETGTAVSNQGVVYGEEQVAIAANGDIVLAGQLTSPQISIKTENNVVVSRALGDKPSNGGHSIPYLPEEKAIMWNISEADSEGISFNRINNLFVGRKGLIINNSADSINTEIAGMIEGNANLKSNPARFIIGEVKNGHSVISGDIEIAGKKADLLIASPNGLSLYGGKAINMGKLTFVTGKWFLHDQTPHITISEDDGIEVGEDGFNGENTQGVAFITNKVTGEEKVIAPSLQKIGKSNINERDIRSDKQDSSTVIPIVFPEKRAAWTYTGENGATIINIASPDTMGVSHNQLSSFQVTPSGTVFNNSLENVITETAGKIGYNTNLGLKEANLIIGEIQGERSHINGNVEIAGRRASLVLANPNGITLHNGKIIHAERVTLLSGTVMREEKDMYLNTGAESLEQAAGSVTATDTKQVNLIGSKIRLGGTLHVTNGNVLVGSGELSYSDLQYRHINTNQEKDVFEITSTGILRGQSIAFRIPHEQIDMIHAGTIDVTRNLLVDVSGNILQSGVMRSPILSIKTGNNIENRGVLYGENIEIYGQDIINHGRILGTWTNVRAEHLENAGEKNQSLGFQLDEIEEKEKKAKSDLEKANRELGEFFAEVGGPDNAMHMPELEGAFAELTWCVTEAEKKLKAIQEEKEALIKTIEGNKEAYKGGIIYGSQEVGIQSDYVYNRMGAAIHSDGNLYVIGKDVEESGKEIHNDGGTIYAQRDSLFKVSRLHNTNGHLKLRTVIGEWQADPDRIEIDAPGDEYNHVIATKEYFRNLTHRHTYQYVPHANEIGKYHKITDDMIIAYCETNPYVEEFEDERDLYEAWEDDAQQMEEIITTLGIQTDVQGALTTEVLTVLVEQKLKEKYGKTLKEYNQMVDSYNISKNFSNYWEIHSRQRMHHTELIQSIPGTIISEGSMNIQGNVSNKDSLIQSGLRLDISGDVENRATVAEKKIEHEGTIEHSVPHEYWHWGNHTKRVWEGKEAYKEPDEGGFFYMPTIAYIVDKHNKENVAALTEGEKKSLENGRYLASEETEGDKKNLVLTMYHDTGLEEKTASSLITAKEIGLHGNVAVINEGTLLANGISADLTTVTNKGVVHARDIVMKVEDTISNSGLIRAEKKLTGEANHIRVTTDSIMSSLPTTTYDMMNGIIVDGEGGLLYLKGNNELLVRNQRVAATGTGGKIVLNGLQNITLDVDTITKKIGTTESENHVQTITTDSGNLIEASGDIVLQAGQDIYVKASAIRSDKGNVFFLSENDIEITTGKNLMDEHYYWRHKHGGFGFGRRGTNTQTHNGYEKQPIPTEIQGEKVHLVAKRDVNLLSANTIDRTNTLIKAGRNITSAVDTSLRKDEYTRTYEGSGIAFDGFFGIRIGHWKEEHHSQSETETPVPTTITSIDGTVNLEAEGKIHATTTYIYGKDGVTITGADILLDGASASEKYSQTDAYHFTGLTLGLGGSAVSKVKQAYVFADNAFRARDKRLAILEAWEAADHAKEGKKIWENTGKGGLTLSVALTKEKQEQSYDSILVRHVGGKIGSEGTITLKVKDLQQGAITLVGQTLTGKEIFLETHKLAIQADTVVYESDQEHKSEEVHVGADVGKASWMEPSIGFSKEKQTNTEKETIYTPTVINGDHVTLHVGGNLSIDGSLVAGKQVDVTVGNDMSIESRQESYTYRSKNAGIGASISLHNSSGQANAGHIDYRYKTVKEQAGIVAGKEGVRIKVKGKTTLTGAIIDSMADREKNIIETGDLSMRNIENKSSTSGNGVGVGHEEGPGTKRNEKGLTPMIPISVAEKRSSITYAAITDGKLVITGNTAINVDEVNRHTQDTLNSLEKSLDVQSMEEKKRLSQLFAKRANAVVHELSDKNHWKEGSAEKVLLHGIVGGISAKLGGDKVIAGALPDVVNEVMNGEINKYEKTHGKVHPAMRQWLSAALGAVVNRAVGETWQTGAATAAYGTRWNLLAKDAQERLNEFLVERVLREDWPIEDAVFLLAKFHEYSEENEAKEKSNSNVGEVTSEGILSPVYVYGEGEYLNPETMKQIAVHYKVDFTYDTTANVTDNIQNLMNSLKEKSGFNGWKSLAESLTSEKGNRVLSLLEKNGAITSKVLKGGIKAGGVGTLLTTSISVVDIHNNYSGLEWWKAQATNALPIIGGVQGGKIGERLGVLAGPVGMAVGMFGGGIMGEIGGSAVQYWLLNNYIYNDRKMEILHIIEELNKKNGK